MNHDSIKHGSLRDHNIIKYNDVSLLQLATVACSGFILNFTLAKIIVKIMKK